MTVWSWIYLLLWPVAAVVAARLLLEGLPGMPKPIALLMGLFAAAAWPFWTPFLLLWVGARRFLVTSHERRAAERAELEQLRKYARTLGLPLGPLDGEDRT